MTSKKRSRTLAHEQELLALDITLVQPKARAHRLRAGSDAGSDLGRGDDGRRVLARFLGARAAGCRYGIVYEFRLPLQ